MSDRDDLIVAGANALIGVPISGPGDIAVAVIDAVEPLIRADEREFLAPEVPWARDDLRNELRAKVEALPTRGIGARVIGEELETFALVERAEVLALLGESSNGATD